MRAPVSAAPSLLKLCTLCDSEAAANTTSPEERIFLSDPRLVALPDALRSIGAAPSRSENEVLELAREVMEGKEALRSNPLGEVGSDVAALAAHATFTKLTCDRDPSGPTSEVINSPTHFRCASNTASEGASAALELPDLASGISQRTKRRSRRNPIGTALSYAEGARVQHRSVCCRSSLCLSLSLQVCVCVCMCVCVEWVGV